MNKSTHYTRYKIDPVQGTCIKKNAGLQEINDTCYGICAAYSGTVNTYDMDPECSKACEDLIERKKYELFDVGTCDHQAPYRPVIWNDIVHYIPGLLNAGNTPKEALKKCNEQCEKYMGNLTEECKEACLVDYSSIVQPYMEPTKLSRPIRLTKEGKDSKANNIILYLTIISALLAVLMVIYIRFERR